MNIDWEESICDCGSTDCLSKHLTMITGHVSLTHPLCRACRSELRSGVRELYAELQPWHKPENEQREYLKKLLLEGV